MKDYYPFLKTTICKKIAALRVTYRKLDMVFETIIILN